MAYKFEVGAKYEAPKEVPAMYFTVIKKTDCFVWLDTDGWGNEIFKKKIRYCGEGEHIDEYVKLTHKDFITLYCDRYVLAEKVYLGR